MLILSRKKNESVIINSDITVVVVEIRGDKVRLGIEAPKEVPVHSRQVFDAIHRDPNGDHAQRIRRQIHDLKEQIRNLETELSRITSVEPQSKDSI